MTTDFRQGGWVDGVAHGHGRFVLRNASGRWQVRARDGDEEVADRINALRRETVVEVKGRSVVGSLPEVVCGQLTVLNRPRRLPFAPERSSEAPRGARAKYRYLDLRQDRRRELLVSRHLVVDRLWRFYADRGFVSVDTPVLSFPSGSGAEQFAVLNRRTGEVAYELPQSPQIYGQLLTCAGIERYFQFAHCFRNEDLRANRQPEFVQLNLEMAFADAEELMALVEASLNEAYSSVGAGPLKPFEQLTSGAATAAFGTDLPDIRYRVDLEEVGSAEKVVGDHPSRIVTRLPRGPRLTPPQWKQAISEAEQHGYALATLLGDRGAPIAVDAMSRRARAIRGAVWAGTGDPRHVHRALYRQAVKHPVEERNRFVWIVDFPLFTENGSTAVDPYTSILVAPQSVTGLMRARSHQDLIAQKGRSFDLVVDGEEVATGSVLNHLRDVQARIFRHVGIEGTDLRRFKFLLDCLDCGAPPIVGLGLGVDRLVALMCGAEGIRDVIAFPKSRSGRCPITWREGPTSTT